jgi:tRNA threonylcarbamoyladenosine biosynthesis protein TsaE
LGHEVVLLVGELGAGKTVFAKGLAAGLGLEDARQVCSPSYTLLNIYQGKHLIFHFDLYRLDTPADIDDLGLEDYLDRGVVIVEWAEKLRFSLEAIRVEISVGPASERTIRITR